MRSSPGRGWAAAARPAGSSEPFKHGAGRGGRAMTAAQRQRRPWLSRRSSPLVPREEHAQGQGGRRGGGEPRERREEGPRPPPGRWGKRCLGPERGGRLLGPAVIPGYPHGAVVAVRSLGYPGTGPVGFLGWVRNGGSVRGVGLRPCPSVPCCQLS